MSPPCLVIVHRIVLLYIWNQTSGEKDCQTQPLYGYRITENLKQYKAYISNN